LVLGASFTIVGILMMLGVITAIIGLPVTGFGLLFLVPGAFLFRASQKKAQTTLKVLREGQTANGQIDSVGLNRLVRVNQRHPWIIKYSFQIMGQDYKGQVSTLNQPGSHLKEGSPAYVLYLPDSPKRNALYPHP
jgi:hypothetical protein